MKKAILVLLTIGMLYSCNNDDDTTNTEILGNWVLTEMSGSTQDPPVTGAQMEWQETYTLNVNETFIKTRQRDGIITQVSGTYTVFYPQDTGRILELTFNSDNDIIGNCSSDLVEHMTFQSENTFLSDWLACDGPGLRYEKLINP